MITYNFSVYENNNWQRVKNVIFPSTTANLLDEQLDEIELYVKSVEKNAFRPNTLCLLTITVKDGEKYREQKTITPENPRVNISWEAHYNDNNEIDYYLLTETLLEFFSVANDKANEYPIGSGRYNHELYLIELTKITEGYIGDSITFTNPLSKNYNVEIVSDLQFVFSRDREGFAFADANFFETPTSTNTLPVPSMADFSDFQNNALHYGAIKYGTQYYKVCDENNNTVIKAELRFINHGTNGATWYEGAGWYERFFEIINISQGQGQWRTGRIWKESDGYDRDNPPEYYLPEWNYLGFGNLIDGTYSLVYNFYLANNNHSVSAKAYFSKISGVSTLPPKKWTITDVINRINDTIVPLRNGQKPKFRLQGVIYDANGNVIGYEQGSLAEKLDREIAPEFSFTQMTLREMYQQVGGFIHGEPRIIGIENNPRCYIVGYDFYGGRKYSKISTQKYVSQTAGWDINDYATGLDSSAQNLVNRMDFAQGVQVYPFIDGATSLRSDTVTVRLGEDENTFIPTKKIDRPIQVNGLVYIDANNNEYDLTSYLLEKANYDRLSSYAGTYPDSKSFALYYEMGEPNIKGLFFRAEDAIDEYFQNYAIVNIIWHATGHWVQTPQNYSEYIELKFRITYQSESNARIKTIKPNIIGGIPRNLNYNQNANLIETRFYGSHLSAVILRMGNAEKTFTYNLTHLYDLPVAGTLFDDRYYISAVNVEYLPTYFRCTVVLSKDFNRLSQYVGVSSDRRMWEISERQAQDRDTVIPEYLVIEEGGIDRIYGDENTIFKQNERITVNGLDYRGVANIIIGDSGHDYPFRPKPVSACFLSTYEKNNEKLAEVMLPVTSLAIGNSMIFRVSMLDNYSAGSQLQWVADANSVTGYWANYVPYTNKYGRFYWLGLSFYLSRNQERLEIEKENYFNELPNVQESEIIGGYKVISTENYKIRNRHDNREIPSVAYELMAVSGQADKYYLISTNSDEAGAFPRWKTVITDGTGYNGYYYGDSPTPPENPVMNILWYDAELGLLAWEGEWKPARLYGDDASLIVPTELHVGAYYSFEYIVGYCKPAYTEEVVIGSALMQNCNYVNNSRKITSCYGLTEKISPLTRTISLENAVSLRYKIKGDRLEVYAPETEPEVPIVAWALITNTTAETINVQDEDGNVTTQTIYNGGELVVGQNKKPQGQYIYFTVKKDIYD